MTKKELRDFIKSRLGCPMVRVELTDDQLDYSLYSARNEGMKGAVGNSTQEVFFTMPLSANQTEYELPVVVKSIIDMKDISGSGRGGINTLFTAENYLYNRGFFDFLTYAQRPYGLLDYHITMDFLDIIDKYLPSNYTWGHQPFANILEIAPPPPSGNSLTLVDGTTIDSPGFIMLRAFIAGDQTVSTSTSGAFREWIGDEPGVQDYATALAKINLGMVRRKFANFQSLGNVGISMDGDTLVSEGKEEKERLEERLRLEEPDEGGILLIG